jgi:hypothetical protein
MFTPPPPLPTHTHYTELLRQPPPRTNFMRPVGGGRKGLALGSLRPRPAGAAVALALGRIWVHTTRSAHISAHQRTSAHALRVHCRYVRRTWTRKR